MRLGVKFNWSEWVNLSEPSGELNAGRLSCLDGALAFLLRKKCCRRVFWELVFHVFRFSKSREIGGRTWNRTRDTGIFNPRPRRHLPVSRFVKSDRPVRSVGTYPAEARHRAYSFRLGPVDHRIIPTVDVGVVR